MDKNTNSIVARNIGLNTSTVTDLLNKGWTLILEMNKPPRWEQTNHILVKEKN